jgi:hypothetical protein
VELRCDAMSSTVDFEETFGQTCPWSFPVGSILRTGIHAEMLVQFLAFTFGEPFLISS